VRIREATADDARSLLGLKRGLDRETSFMLLEPDERTTTEREIVEELRGIAARPNSAVLVAEDRGELVGYVEAIGGGARRNRKRPTSSSASGSSARVKGSGGGCSARSSPGRGRTAYAGSSSR
jgi:hypothetical protein